MVAYYDVPPWARIAQRTLLSFRYLALAGIGLLCLFLVPVPTIIGVVLLLTSFSAFYGVLSRRYRWEWVALPPMVSALLIAVLVLMGDADFPVLLLVATLALMLADRWVHLTRVASEQRELTPRRYRRS